MCKEKNILKSKLLVLTFAFKNLSNKTNNCVLFHRIDPSVQVKHIFFACFYFFSKILPDHR